MQAVIDYLHRNTIPLVSSALAALLALAFWRFGPLVPYLLFLGAVVVSAWWGGFRPGLLAIVLASVLLALMYRNMARGTVADSPQQFLFRLGTFSGIALLAGMVGQQCRTAVRAIDRVQDVLSGSGLGMISTDARGRVVSVNSQATALTGWTEEAARGLALGDVLQVMEGGSARRRVSVPVADLLGKPSRFDLPEGSVLVGQGGQEVSIDGSVASLGNSGGTPGGVVATFRDVGGRIQALEELRTAAERSQAVLAQAAAPLLLIDDDGRCTFANTPAQQALGCTAEECQGEGWARHVQRQDRAQLFAEAPAALRKRQPFGMEVRVQHPRGGLRWLRLASCPVAAPGGSNGKSLLGHSVVLEDLSPLKQAEAQVQEQARLTEAVLEAVEDPVLVKNHLGAPVAMNAAARTLLGVEEGVTGSEALAFDDSHRLTEAERTARSTRQRQSADLTVSGEIGSRLFEAVAVPRSDDKGDVVGTVNVLRDVTGSRQKERDLRETAGRLQALLENLPGFFYLKDEGGRYVLANRAFEELVGCEAEAWKCRGDEDLLPGPLAAALWKHEKALPAEVGVRQVMEMLPRGEEQRTYLVRRFRVGAGAEGGALSGAIGVDLTGQKQAAEEVRAARDELAGRLMEQEGRHREAEETLQRLVRETQQGLEAAQEARRRAEEALAQARQDGHGRAELQRLLDEARNALAGRAEAEGALRRQSEEHAGALREEREGRRRAEDELKRIRQDLQRQLEEAVAARLLAEGSLDQARRELAARLREAVQGREEAEHSLRRSASESLSEQGRLMAGHFHVAEQLGATREELQRLLAEREGKRHLSEEEWRRREEAVLAGRLELEARLREAEDRQGLAERSLRHAAGESLAEHARLMAGQYRTGEELGGVRGELQALLARTHGKRLLSEEEWQQILAERDGEWGRKVEEWRRRAEQSEAGRLSLEGLEGSLRQQVEDARRAHREAEAVWQAEQDRLAGEREAARREQGRLAAVLEGSPVLAGARDLEGRFLYGNAALARALGRTAAGLPGVPAGDVLPAAVATAWDQAERQARDDGRFSLAEEEWPGAGGPRTYLACRYPLRDSRGEVFGVGSLAVDVTGRRREAEAAGERLAKLREELAGAGQALDVLREEKVFLTGVLDGLAEGVAAYDGSGRCLVWNAVMERWSGTAREVVLGQAGMAGFPGAAAEALQAGLQAALNGGSRKVALDGPRFDGEEGERPAEALHGPVRTKAGARVGGMAVVRARVRVVAQALPGAPATQQAEPRALAGAARAQAKNGSGAQGEGHGRGNPARAPSPDDPEWLSFN